MSISIKFLPLHMDRRAALPFSLLAFLVSSSAVAYDPCPTRSDASDHLISIVHSNGPCSPFASSKRASSSSGWADTLMDVASSSDSQRLAYLSSSSLTQTPAIGKVPIASGLQKFSRFIFVVRVKVGAFSNQTMYPALDIGSDDTWLPCDGCSGCTSATFSTAASPTYVPLNCSSPQCALLRATQCPATTACSYNQTYGDASSSFATVLSKDSLTLGDSVLPMFTFGCIKEVAGTMVPPQGSLGLGRGPLSLLSQVSLVVSLDILKFY